MSDGERAAQTDDLGEYTRRRINVQLGDGPDQRGDVTVEMVRQAGQENASFAEFHEETDRAVRTLKEQLNLTRDND